MRLETERLILRPFCEDDLHDLFIYGSQEDVFSRSVNLRLQTVNDAKLLLDRWIKKENQLAIVWKKTNHVIGNLSISPDSEEKRQDTRELGFSLNKVFHRRGIMSEAVRAVLRELFDTGIEHV